MGGENQKWIRRPCLWGGSSVLTFLTGLAYFTPWSWPGPVSGVDPWHFLLGVLVVLPVGHAGAIGTLALYRKKPGKADARRRAMWTGLLERTVMAIAVATSVGSAVVGSGAGFWIGAKMAANWQARAEEGGQRAPGSGPCPPWPPQSFPSA